MNKRYYTVVYEITDEESFKTVAEAAASAAGLGELQGVLIHACGEGDYATESNAYCKELMLLGREPLDVVANYIRDEHPDGITADQAAHLAAAVCSQ